MARIPLIGHADQMAMFRRALQRGRTAHAYLLVGSDGIGKRQFAGLSRSVCSVERPTMQSWPPVVSALPASRWPPAHIPIC